MKLTKYEHACFTLEDNGKVLVVDPGGFTTDFIAPENVVGIVITHKHSDHFDQEQLAGIIDKNPEAVVISHEAITSEIEVFQTTTVAPGDRIEVGPFRLQFVGGKHALIHASIPLVANVGVIINDLVYYPGDSFTFPGTSVDTLAIPAAAPWMKVGEAMDFLAEIRPRLAFPTHDAILSDEGKEVYDAFLAPVAQKNGIEYTRFQGPVNI